MNKVLDAVKNSKGVAVAVAGTVALVGLGLLVARKALAGKAELDVHEFGQESEEDTEQ